MTQQDKDKVRMFLTNFVLAKLKMHDKGQRVKVPNFLNNAIVSLYRQDILPKIKPTAIIMYLQGNTESYERNPFNEGNSASLEGLADEIPDMVKSTTDNLIGAIKAVNEMKLDKDIEKQADEAIREMPLSPS